MIRVAESRIIGDERSKHNKYTFALYVVGELCDLSDLNGDLAANDLFSSCGFLSIS